MKCVRCFSKKLQLLLAAVSLLQTMTADAAVLYESAGSMGDFASNYEDGRGRQGWVVQDYRPTWQSSTQFAAMPFTLQQQSQVRGAELALTGSSSNYWIQIRGDNDGFPDSVPMWTISPREPIPLYQRLQRLRFYRRLGRSRSS